MKEQQGFPPHFWLELTKSRRCSDIVEEEMPRPHLEYLSMAEHAALISEAVRVAERLRHHLEMLLPECSCYRAIGMCERCRILEGAKAASTEGG